MTLLEILRLDARLDRKQLADRSGVPVRTIRELESGRVRRPTQRTLGPLADVLDVPVSRLALDFAGKTGPDARAAA
jgi:transcriptional regulator with XRE-family HTH domain